MRSRTGVEGARVRVRRRKQACTRHTVCATHNDDDDDAHDEAHQELHLDVLPPHLVAQRLAALLELVSLVAQVLRLVHQQLQLLPPVQHLLDVLHHDLLHLGHLGKEAQAESGVNPALHTNWLHTNTAAACRHSPRPATQSRAAEAGQAARQSRPPSPRLACTSSNAALLLRLGASQRTCVCTLATLFISSGCAMAYSMDRFSSCLQRWAGEAGSGGGKLELGLAPTGEHPLGRPACLPWPPGGRPRAAHAPVDAVE
jgi:hypothetical protein